MKTINLILIILAMLMLLSCRSSDKDPSEFYLQGLVTDEAGNPISGAEIFMVFDLSSGSSLSGSKDPTTVSQMQYRYSGSHIIFTWDTTFELNLTEFNILQGNPANHQIVNPYPITPTNNAYGSSYSYTHETIIQDEFWLEAKDSYGMDQHLGPFEQYLPVELSSFTAVVDENMHVVLTWVTESETLLMGFYVLRSESNEVVNAYPVSPLMMAYNSNSTQTYTYNDVEVSSGHTYYYWLKVISLNGLEDLYGPVSASLQTYELSSFYAINTPEYYVNLYWTTEYETNLYGFRLLRSEMANVSQAVTITPTLIYATNTSSPHTYNFTDTEVEAEHTYFYWLETVEMDGNSAFHGPMCILTDGPNPPPLPQVLAFQNPYPNPAINSVRFDCAVPDSVNVVVRIRRAGLNETLKEYSLTAGDHPLVWDCTDINGNKVSNGCYVVTCNATNILSGDLQAQIIRHFLVNDPSLTNTPITYSDGSGYKLPINTAYLWDMEYIYTDENGDNLAEGTMPRSVTVYVKKDGYETASQQITLDLSRDNQLNFVLHPLRSERTSSR